MAEAGEINPQPQVEGSRVKKIFRKVWHVAFRGRQDNGVDLQALPFVGRQIAELDSQVAVKGMPLAIKEHFQKWGINISPEYSQETLETLKNDPILLVATHPQLTDVVGIMGALPKERNDVYLVGNSLYSNAGENLSAHLIPIYGVANQKTNNLRSRLWRETGFEQPPPSLIQAARLNIESLRVARQRVNEGGLVVIFPDGSKEAGGEWFNGVGEIVRQLKDNPQIKIVFATAQGSKSRDKLRFFPKAAQLLGQTDLRIKFSQPHSIDEYQSAQSTKQSITQQLRSQYDSFSKILA